MDVEYFLSSEARQDLEAWMGEARVASLVAASNEITARIEADVAFNFRREWISDLIGLTISEPPEEIIQPEETLQSPTNWRKEGF